jgi:hypothetical protein
MDKSAASGGIRPGLFGIFALHADMVLCQRHNLTKTRRMLRASTTFVCALKQERGALRNCPEAACASLRKSSLGNLRGPTCGWLPKPVIAYIGRRQWGHVAEWLRSGLQNRLHQFNSGRGLHSQTPEIAWI